MMKNARSVMVFLIDWVGVSGFTYYPFMIWPGMPFVHVHIAGHARIRVRGVSHTCGVSCAPCMVGDGLF